MNRMYDAQTRQRGQSQNVAPLFAALAKAQGEFKNVIKRRPGHNFKYADIADVLEMALPILSKHGLSVMQPFTDTEMVTIIAHESGVFKEFRASMKLDSTSRMNEAQKVGASVTYFRRYHLCSILGIATEDEMDARLRDRNAPDEKWGDAREPNLNTGVKGVDVPNDAAPADKAKAFTEGIIGQLQEAKTQRGIDGVWRKNESVIARLQASYSDLYQDLLDATEARQRALKEQEAA